MSADAQAISSFGGRTAWARNLAAPVRSFLSTETGGAFVMLGAAVAALIWANVPGCTRTSRSGRRGSRSGFGGHGLRTDLRHWVNEGLMTFFFLVVGLEAKRELDLGELRERRRLAIPVFAGLGGIAVPIVIYLAFNAGGAGAHGWGAAMSTDTAFALGTLALAHPADGDARARVPAHAGDRRRPRRAGRDHARLHRARPLRGAADRARLLRARCWRCATRRRRRGPAVGRGRRSGCGWRCSSPASTRSSAGSRSGWRPAPTRPRARTSSAPARSRARSASSRRPSSPARRSAACSRRSR